MDQCQQEITAEDVKKWHDYASQEVTQDANASDKWQGAKSQRHERRRVQVQVKRSIHWLWIYAVGMGFDEWDQIQITSLLSHSVLKSWNTFISEGFFINTYER